MPVLVVLALCLSAGDQFGPHQWPASNILQRTTKQHSPGHNNSTALEALAVRRISTTRRYRFPNPRRQADLGGFSIFEHATRLYLHGYITHILRLFVLSRLRTN